MSSPRYSLVIPVYNEQETIRELHARVSAVLAGLDGDSEVIVVDDASDDATYPLLVDDGSTDATPALLAELERRDERFRAVRLSRNFGHQIAITAGIDAARGEAIVVLDGDLQDPPEVIPQLVARWREGYDVVYGVRVRRGGEGWLKRVTASLYYRFLRRAAETDVPVDAGDFRLIDRRVADVFRALPERNRYVRGMFAWLGYRQVGVPYERQERFAGTRKYSFAQSLKLAIDGLVSFSTAPLRLVLALGFAIAAVSFLVGLFAVGARIGGLYATPGWASILLVVSFLGGMQLTLVGVVGVYVGRMYDELKGRPLYVVSEAHGLAADEDRELVRDAVRPGGDA